MTFGYDSGGNVTSRRYADGTQLTLAYNVNSQLSSLIKGTTTLAAYTYDAAGNRLTTKLATANGYTETRVLNAASDVVSVSNTKGTSVLSKSIATRDADGNPLTIATLRGTTTTTDAFSYDSASRLIRHCPTPTTCTATSASRVTYAYDLVGNRVSEDRVGVTNPSHIGYTHDTSDQPASVATTVGTTTTNNTLTSDPNGNLATDPAGRALTYNLANQLTKITQTNGASTSFTYDLFGNRFTQRGAAPVGIAKDPDIDYRWDPTTVLPQIATEKSGSTWLRTYLNADTPVGQTTGAATNYFHRDLLGSVTDVTDVTNATGAAQWRYSYDGFGTATPTKVNSAATENRLQYTGGYSDPALGTVHLGAREYSPTMGRFTAVDPLAAPITRPVINSYAYASNRPTVFTDPTGLCNWNPWSASVTVCGADLWNGTAEVLTGGRGGLAGEIAASTSDALVNFGRGATGGLTNNVEDWISPSASCTVDGSSLAARIAQGGGFLGALIAGDGASLAPKAGARTAAGAEGGLIRLTTRESWANPRTLADHFARHGGDFGAKSADDYAAQASGFL